MADSTNSTYQDVNEQKASENFYIALLAAYAIGLHSIEALVPTPIPWLRFGFANIITLTTIILYGLKAGMTVTIIRVFIGSLFTGTFLGPGFVLSLGGGIASTLTMWAARDFLGRLFSPLGLSIIGALAHNLAQLYLANLFFIQRIEAILFITPIIVLLGTITGALNGVVTGLIIKKVGGLARNA
jgi:heptaprenyl diphosphate synthase